MEKDKYNKITDTYLQGLKKHLLGDAVRPEEVIAIANAIIELIKKQDEKISQKLATETKALTTQAARRLSETASRLERLIADTKTGTDTKLSATIDRLLGEVSRVEKLIPSMPDIPDIGPVLSKIAEVEKKIPVLPPEKLGEDYRNALEALNGDDRLDKKAIRGIEDLEKAIASAKDVRVVNAPSRGMFLYIDGVKKGLISNLNLVAGTNMAIAYTKTNGQDTLTFNATGGGPGGITVETPPETPNASTTVFTVTAEPQWVVADGTTYFDGQGYTYAALQITMDVPPSASIKVII